MLHGILTLLAVTWAIDGLALVFSPRTAMELLRNYLDRDTGLSRWWGLTGLMGLALLVLPEMFRFQPLWLLVGGAMILKGLFVGLAPETWRKPAVAWSVSREDVDYRLWGLALCTFALLLGKGLGAFGSQPAP
ncbi:MAG: hypothetical protein NW703_01930 [Nitrospiraceae bacterium]